MISRSPGIVNLHGECVFFALADHARKGLRGAGFTSVRMRLVLELLAKFLSLNRG
jgi:hypothetical protein